MLSKEDTLLKLVVHNDAPQKPGVPSDPYNTPGEQLPSEVPGRTNTPVQIPEKSNAS